MKCTLKKDFFTSQLQLERLQQIDCLDDLVINLGMRMSLSSASLILDSLL